MNRSAHFALTALASTVLALAGPPAHAALGGPSGIVIPYAGKLELNGALVTGSIDFRFEVLVNSTTATVCQTVPLTVLVTNGEFAVTIPGVSEACVKGQDVHLQIAVKQGVGSFVVLGKQRVTPVLGALTSGPGDFAVTGALTANTAAVTGALSAASAAVTGAVTATSLSTSSVVVRSNDNIDTTNIADFKAQNQTQGVGIGFNRVRATGSIAAVALFLEGKGTGVVVVNDNLEVTGGATVAGTLGIGYFAGTCSSYGSIGGLGLGFCACPAGTVVLGGAANCNSQGGVKVTEISTQAVNLEVGILPAQAYVAACNNGVAPRLVQVMCARLGP
jgi:hypothetical protein